MLDGLTLRVEDQKEDTYPCVLSHWVVQIGPGWVFCLKINSVSSTVTVLARRVSQVYARDNRLSAVA